MGHPGCLRRCLSGPSSRRPRDPTSASGTAHWCIGRIQTFVATRSFSAGTSSRSSNSAAFAPPPDCHHQGVGRWLRRYRGTHRPANRAPREQINDGSQIEPALCRPHIREVGNPSTLGVGASEVRLSTLGAMAATCRSPRSGGRRRRRGRALRVRSRINCSIWCRPHDTPSASMRYCSP